MYSETGLPPEYAGTHAPLTADGAAVVLDPSLAPLTAPAPLLADPMPLGSGMMPASASSLPPLSAAPPTAPFSTDYGVAPAPPPMHGGGGLSLGPKNLVIIPLCRKGDRAGIEKQLQAGATVHETDIEGNTPLHVAVEAPKNEIATVQCLLENGANVNAVNYIGATPLHYVCLRKSNFRGVANILLENGAMINLQTVAGKSTLHFACENQLPELVQVLCLFGADVNLMDAELNSPVHLTLLREGGRDTVKREILEHLIMCSAQCVMPNAEGLCPLHLACRSGYVRCVQLLVDQRADVACMTARGQTGLYLACQGGHPEVAQLLLATASALVDTPDIEGNTPLHVCAMVGNLDCALLLLKMDANTNLRNNARKTAFEVSKVKGTDLNSTHNPELVQVLKDAKKGASCRQS
mmetsp:Transcript_88364/g.153048  ORF Transcript_88364/g.153048 Transcript_88364/m.153048 type:complete len:409 (-) Transcript_88364:221-1447(-)